MEPKFVPAEISDMEILLEMMQDFYDHERLTFDEQAARKALHQILTRDCSGRVFLMRCDDEVAGYAVLTFGFSLEFHGRDAFVDELYIVPGHRGRSIGKQTLTFLMSVCRELNIEALHLEVERANIIAQNVYRSAGFVDHDRYLMTRQISIDARIKTKDQSLASVAPEVHSTSDNSACDFDFSASGKTESAKSLR